MLGPSIDDNPYPARTSPDAQDILTRPGLHPNMRALRANVSRRGESAVRSTLTKRYGASDASAYLARLLNVPEHSSLESDVDAVSYRTRTPTHPPFNAPRRPKPRYRYQGPPFNDPSDFGQDGNQNDFQKFMEGNPPPRRKNVDIIDPGYRFS